MKSVPSLRVLSLLGFLLLIAPFYDHCNGHGMRITREAPVEAPALEEVAPPVNEEISKEIEIDTIIIEEIVERETIIADTSFFQKAYLFLDDRESHNAFEMAISNECYFEMTFEEFKLELVKDFKEEHCRGIAFHIKILCFAFIVLLSFLILLFSFKNKWNWIYKAAFTNLILLFITIICILFFEGLFEDIRQIKWGYYVFTLVQILILVLSKREKLKKNIK